MRTTARALLIAAAAAWVYFPCLRGGWLWDDGLEVVQNAALRAPDGWWRPWVHPEGMDYFPLKSSLQWLEWRLWGTDPAGYHLVSVCLHVASALLLWRLLHLLGVRAAFLGGLLFAVHPLAVESVAWISEFKNTVSLPPLLLACIAYVEFDRDRRRRTWIASILWFAAALACKTSVVMFPCVLLVFAWWRRGRVDARDLRDAAPFFGASAAMGVATLWFQSTRAIGLAGTQVPLWGRVGQAGWSIASYARLSLWPVGLSPIYPPAEGSPPAILPWLALAAFLGLIWAFRAGWGRPALLASGWFLLNLVPVLGIIPMAYLRISPRADHFAYVPLIGCVGLAAAAFGAAAGPRGGRAGGGARWRLPWLFGAGAAVLVLAVESHAYAAVFGGEKALWTRAVASNPNAWLARNNLGRVLLGEGHAGEAAVEFQEALRLEPDSPEAHANLGNCLAAQGFAADALREYAAALAIDPGFAGAHYDLGLLLLRSGRRDEAAGEFRTTVKLDPGHAAAHNNLGLALAGSGKLSEAMDEYRLALGLNPRLPEAHLNLGNAFFRMGRLDDAVAQYREALRIDPGYAGAHANLGRALAELGRAKEAEAEFDRASGSSNR
jgi:tetratricopeptide (TPR) repeat protein